MPPECLIAIHVSDEPANNSKSLQNKFLRYLPSMFLLR